MAVDPASSSASSEYMLQKKKELEDLENGMIIDKARLERQRNKELSAINEKTNQDMIQISKEGEAMLEKSRSMRVAQLHTTTDASKAHFEQLAQETSKRLQELDAHSTEQLLAHQRASMEKVQGAADKMQDPFYRGKSFDANIAEKESSYDISLKLPPHEAQNLFVSIEGNTMKFTLARTHGVITPLEGNRENRTSNYQTIVESYKLPTHVDGKTLKRDYKDGTLTISVAKLL